MDFCPLIVIILVIWVWLQHKDIKYYVNFHYSDHKNNVRDAWEGLASIFSVKDGEDIKQG